MVKYFRTSSKDGALSTVKVNRDSYVTGILHDAKGQRQAIWYGNGTKTGYTYDPDTYRVTCILTIRLSDNAALQDLNYWYDAVGNITQLRDEAQETVFYNNQMVAPVQDYTYDARYRLIKAMGRESIGSNGYGDTDNTNDAGMMQGSSAAPFDGQALRNYTQTYEYDAVGNILSLSHAAAGGSYTRSLPYLILSKLAFIG